MAPTASTSSALSHTDRATLLRVARQSIAWGLAHGGPLAVDPMGYPETLRPLRATFVTLERDAQLRGCIGTLEARLSLVADVVEHAHAAAFYDPRFPPLREEELATLEIHISVLSPSEPVGFTSEQTLLAQLRPGIDGLVLRLGERRATFLPAVWESLPDPHAFLAHLKMKAGLPLDFWSDAIQIERYTTESFGETDLG